MNYIAITVLAIMGTVVVVVLMKLSTHRVLVEKLNIVKGGYVITAGRYRQVVDKKSKLTMLRPMFGAERLPAFSSDCYQKVMGFPIIGITRTISMIFKNKYSPVVCLPQMDASTEGQIMTESVKRWYYTDQREMFLKKYKRGDWAYFLTIYAPAVIILGAITFWAITIYLQWGQLNQLGEELNQMLREIR